LECVEAEGAEGDFEPLIPAPEPEEFFNGPINLAAAIECLVMAFIGLTWKTSSPSLMAILGLPAAWLESAVWRTVLLFAVLFITGAALWLGLTWIAARWPSAGKILFSDWRNR